MPRADCPQRRRCKGLIELNVSALWSCNQSAGTLVIESVYHQDSDRRRNGPTQRTLYTRGDYWTQGPECAYFECSVEVKPSTAGVVVLEYVCNQDGGRRHNPSCSIH